MIVGQASPKFETLEQELVKSVVAGLHSDIELGSAVLKITCSAQENDAANLSGLILVAEIPATAYISPCITIDDSLGTDHHEFDRPFEAVFEDIVSSSMARADSDIRSVFVRVSCLPFLVEFQPYSALSI